MIALLMGLRTISPENLQRFIREKTATIIDVNSRDSWQKARVPGAHHLAPERFSERDIPADRNRILVFYCSNPWCRKAPRAARRAVRMGFSDVRVLSAGIKGWLANKLPVESGNPS